MSYRSKNWLEQKFHDANIKGLARNVYRSAVEAYEFAKSHGAQDRTEATILAAYHRTLFEIIVQMHRAQTELRRARDGNQNPRSVAPPRRLQAI